MREKVGRECKDRRGSRGRQEKAKGKQCRREEAGRGEAGRCGGKFVKDERHVDIQKVNRPPPPEPTVPVQQDTQGRQVGGRHAFWVVV